MPYITAILAWLSYHPANLWFLAWVSYAPMFRYILSAVEPDKDRINIINKIPVLRRMGFKLHIFAAGYLFFFLSSSWVRHVTWAGLFIMAGMLALYWLVFALVMRAILRRGISLWAVLIAPCLWVSLEYIRAFLITGFPWFFAGHTQYSWLALIQMADITGVYGISFIVIMVNMAIALALREYSGQAIYRWKTGLTRIYPLLTPIVILAAVLTYGYIRLERIATEPGPNIGIVQGNIEQSLKINPPDPYDLYEKHLKLSRKLAASQPTPDLIVWAETMFPYVCSMSIGDEWLPQNMDTLKEPAMLCGIPHLIGAVSFEMTDTPKDFRIYNSAYYINENGGITGRYDKIHLVPVSEYVPWRKALPWLDTLILSLSELEEVREMSSGRNKELFRIGKWRFGVLICYESIFPEQTRDIVERGGDFILNLSNDGWFRNSAELEQILAISAFRAVESRRTVIRATNTGISAVIQPSGQIEILKDDKGNYKEIAGAWTKQIPVASGRTFYESWGDYFAVLCLIIPFIWGIIYRIKIRKNA